MKSILLAAAALIAAPAIAQTTTPTDPGASMPQDQTMPPADGTTTTPADPAMAPPGAPQDAPTTQSQMPPAPTTGGDAAMQTPAGGYQPSQPAMSAPMTPGATVRYQAAQDPNTAYPPPAPKASYPICKKGQFDGCTQAGEGHAARKPMRRHR